MHKKIMMTVGRIIPVALTLLSCTPEDTDLPLPLYVTDNDQFFDTPWPSDTRVDEAGFPKLGDFPNPGEIPLLGMYFDAFEDQRGFGTHSPIYFRFGKELTRIPIYGADASLEDDAPIRLINIDPYSPGYGTRVPVNLEFFTAISKYSPSNLLAVAPLGGFPLRPDTTYAVIVTTEIAAKNPTFAKVWQPDHPHHEVYKPLLEHLIFESLSPDQIAVGTVFTTTNPVEEMARMNDFIQNRIGPMELDQTLKRLDTFQDYHLYKGFYTGPLFQHGTRPYTLEGGGFQFREDGMPIIAEWESMRMAVTVPPDILTATPPEGGWPVAVYQHGTGGNYRSIASKSSTLAAGAKLAQAGIIGIGIDQPLHGTRKTGSTSLTDSFNFQNPQAAKGNFRQGALDAIYLIRSLSNNQTRFTIPSEDGLEEIEVPLNSDKVLFMGHSQGGLTGAIALPWMGHQIKGAVLSGTGGGLATTLIERKDPIDIRATIEAILGFDDGEVLTLLHPITGLVQSIVEDTDPINYAPFWFHMEGYWEQTPTPVLLTSGKSDAQTPHQTAEALASAARMPIVEPSMNEPVSLDLRGLSVAPTPSSLNVQSYNGSSVTAGLSQWPDGDHFILFDDHDAAGMYREFLKTALEGQAVIDPNQ